MNDMENTPLNSWERIQNGVRETERCIGQKKYNMAMVKARQTLEYMVKCLCEKSGITEGSLIDMIDHLYEDEIISKTTCEHYHKIRTIGNKAIHEDDHNAYNANQAYHLLSQEVYTFANDYRERRKKPAAAKRGAGDSAADRTAAASAKKPSADSVKNRSAAPAANRRPSRNTRPVIDLETILRPLLLVAIIIVLIFIIKMIHPKQETDMLETPAVSTEAASDTKQDSSESNTDIPTEDTPYYKTTDILNVRSSPSTDKERIGVLNAGAKVDYIGDYDDTWAIIKFNGEDAYVVKEYLIKE